MKPIKHSVAFVIYNPDRSNFVIVKRPEDDKDLPNVWGLPVGSLLEEETFENCVIRSAKEKMGIEVGVGRLVNEGEIDRDDYILHMKEFEARIRKGDILVPQENSNVTQYSEWKWGSTSDLIKAAQGGSLCSQLYLSSIDRIW